MNYHVDIGHPGHVHFFRNFIDEMSNKGEKVVITARNKDVSKQLLVHFGYKYIDRGKFKGSLVSKAVDLPTIDLKMSKIHKKEKIDYSMGILNPYVAQSSRLSGCKSFIFTDTEHAKLAKKLTIPFCHHVLTPSCYEDDHSRKQIRYDGYHELAYLHPRRFMANPQISEKLGLTEGDKIALIRFVSWKASHDVGHAGLSLDDKIKIVKELSKDYTPVITSEGKLPRKLSKYQMKVPPHLIHDILSDASIYIGEGGTMASEAVVLGTPAVYINPLRMGYTNEQEKMGLLKQFDSNIGYSKVIEAVNDFETNRKKWDKQHQKLMTNKIDVTGFLLWFFNGYPNTIEKLESNQKIMNKFKGAT